MKFSSSLITAVAFFVGEVSAHGYVQDLKVGSTWYKGSLPYSDPYQNPIPERIVWSFFKQGDSYVSDVTSKDLVCNADYKTAQLTAPIEAGSTVEIYWTDWPADHKGPTMTYLANCNGECTDITDPSTLGWFKINEDGFYSDSNSWASDKLIAANNSWAVTIPSDIKPGNYLLRHELLALHSASNLNGAQFYPSCTNLKITGSGSVEPDTVKFPGAYKASDPGIHINIYYPTPTTYTIPGPTVYGGSKSNAKATEFTSASGSVSASSSSSASAASSKVIASVGGPYYNSTTAVASSKVTASAASQQTSAINAAAGNSGNAATSAAGNANKMSTSIDTRTVNGGTKYITVTSGDDSVSNNNQAGVTFYQTSTVVVTSYISSTITHVVNGAPTSSASADNSDMCSKEYQAYQKCLA